MDNYFEYLVNETDNLTRVDKFLAEVEPDLSRSSIKKLISEGNVLVNGLAIKASYVVRLEDFIEITDASLFDYAIEAVAMDLDIVYEDDDVLVINKPSGMVVHPAPGHYKDTLVNGLMHHINNLSDINGELRPGIIHRIDKDTSGLLMIAKSNKAHQILAEELKNKETKREYIALVEGVIKNKRGKINAPIGRDRSNRLKMAVIGSGKPAVTNFEVIETFEDKTLIKCSLETGRTHQIRVHLAYINHPVVGDHVYGLADQNDYGQFLHAKTLGFTHPITKKFLEFDSELPTEFLNKINELRQN